jgi:hypothetical protein
MRKLCDDHGEQDALISSNADWYHRVMAYSPTLEEPGGTIREVDQGCPFDCGSCASHEQRNHLPVLAITSACNLDCPICYTHNKNDGAYHMDIAELDAILEHLGRIAPDKRIINITGGEPTLHPDFLDVVERCRDAGVHRVTVSTHGLTFLKDEDMVRRLGELGARVILSFDSFREDVNKAMLGGKFGKPKLDALDLLERHGVSTTLLPVLARGLNDDEIGAFVDLALTRDFIRSVEIHPLTFTGQSGADFDRAARYTTYDALVDLEHHTGGLLRVDDFVPSPVAHSLCYVVTYLLKLDDGRWLPFTRFMPAEDLRALLSGGLYLEPSVDVEQTLQDVINRLWAGDIECDDDELVLASLKRLVGEIFRPGLSESERLSLSEKSTKAVYVHTHMDEETFDTDRIRKCCVGMPAADGSNIPSCAYNILYRERDHRFAPEPAAPLVQLGRGRTG